MMYRRLLTAFVIACIPHGTFADELNPQPDTTDEIREIARLFDVLNRRTVILHPGQNLTEYTAVQYLNALTTSLDDIEAKLKTLECEYSRKYPQHKHYQFEYSFENRKCAGLENILSVGVGFSPDTKSHTIWVNAKGFKSGKIIQPIFRYNTAAVVRRLFATSTYDVDPAWWTTSVKDFSESWSNNNKEDKLKVTKQIATGYFSAALEEKNFSAFYYDSLFDITRQENGR